MLSPFLLMLAMASATDDQPPPPPKREPDPEPGPVDRLPMAGNSMGKTHRIVDPIDHPPRHRPLQFPPWAPSRRVADPEKKRARKAQKRARRAGR